MKQIIKKRGETSVSKPIKKRTASKTTKSVRKVVRKHPKFGTSKLEQDFAKDFLDKLKVEYIWQFEAKDIGRFYDFYLPKHNLIIEVDGSYYHSDPRLVKESEMNPMQKHNKRVDEYKDRWALAHGIPILRIWEKDIREVPDKVMKELKKRLYIENEKQIITEKKNKRHINKIK
jgi:very-short-patch-repair endonuclease